MNKFVVIGACGVLAAPAALAAGHIDVSELMTPGLYQTTSRMSMKDMKMPSRMKKICITKDEIQHFASNLEQQLKKSKTNMHVEDLSLRGKHLHLKLVGTAGSMDMNITFDDPTHYHQTMTATMSGYHMTADSEAHRIGDCKKS